MNDKRNLVVICQKCHDDVDRGKINIHQKIETNTGVKLIYDIIPKEENIKIELTETEESNKKLTEEKVLELNSKKFSQKMIKEKLSKENINLSIGKISKIIGKK